MMLTHICPNCKKEHEMNCTPEPDQLCPVCKLAEERTVVAYIPVKMWVNNNVYCRTPCLFCAYDFKPGMTLFEIPGKGFICPDCVDELNIQVDHLDWKTIDEVQDRFCRGL